MTHPIRILAPQSDQHPSFAVARPALCPRVANPFPDCYCVNLTSAKIPSVLAYCQGDYEYCRLYKDWLTSEAGSLSQDC